MNYFVNWKLSVQDELAAIWLDAPDRDAVTQASRVIDDMLRRSPETVGEQFDATRRILVEPPLAVVFKVVPDDMRVDILDVRTRA